jgi:thiopeptide-type bacteriocin biosynthesis protein
MPADHLTDTPASGRPPDWFQASIRFPDWNSSERVMADVVGPRLDTLAADGATGCWWFLRKHPCWRIRIAGPGPNPAAALLGQLADDHVIDCWQRAIYEPEEYAFGGPAGMSTAHGLFCADSRGVLAYARTASPPIGRREMSLLLISALLDAAGLDWFERGDVFAKVARMRPSPPEGSEVKLAQLTTQLRVLTAVPTAETLTSIGLSPLCMPWLGSFTDAGRALYQAAGSGVLERGLRAVLAHVVIFHWNRLGLAAVTQGILARAATAVYLPED